MVTGAFKPATELRGLALPSTRGPQGVFASKNAFDVAWGDLLLAIFTPRGSRPMNRAFGSSLYELLFDPVGVENEVFEFSVREVVAQFCPHVIVRRVTLSTASSGRVQIGVVFSLTSDRDLSESRTVLVQKSYVSTPGAI